MSQPPNTPEHTDNKRFGRLVLIASLFAMACALSLSSCYNSRKAARQWNKAYELRREVVNAKTEEFYPVRVYDSTRTIFKPGAPDTRSDTVTIRDTVNQTTTRYVTTTHTIHDTVFVEHHRQAESKAGADAARDTANHYRQKYEHETRATVKAQTQKADWRKIALFAGLILAAIIIIRIIRK